MLHVLRHYLPLRKLLLISSEGIILTLVVGLAMSSHLWAPSDGVLHELALDGLDLRMAFERVLLSSLVVAVVCQVVITINELYDVRISGSRHERMARFLASAASAVGASVVFVAIAEVWNLDALLDFPGLRLAQVVALLAPVLLLGFGLLFAWRSVFHALLRRAHFDERILVLGRGRLGQRLVTEIRERPEAGFHVAAVVHGEQAGDSGVAWHVLGASDSQQASAPGLSLLRDDGAGSDSDKGGEGPLRPPGYAASASAVETLTATLANPAQARATSAGTTTLLEVARDWKVDAVIVAFEDRRGSLPTEELLDCRLDGIVVEEAESFYERLTGKIPAEAMRPSYLIFNAGFVQNPLSQSLKRCLDVVLALVGIALTWPLMLITGWLVKNDSPGPMLFKQERTGESGKPFTLMKFRSMREDAEKESGPVWAKEDDPRITRVGSFIRKTRLDELPQLFNILGGSMSLVGPRPERPHFVEDLEERIPFFAQRHVVKPGLTGWAQINYPYGNTEEDALQKLQYDLFYIKYQSLLFDMSIIFHTVKTVLLRKGT